MYIPHKNRKCVANDVNDAGTHNFHRICAVQIYLSHINSSDALEVDKETMDWLPGFRNGIRAKAAHFTFIAFYLALRFVCKCYANS